MSLLTMLKDLHRIAVPRPTLELPCRTLGEYGNKRVLPCTREADGERSIDAERRDVTNPVWSIESDRW